MSRNGERTHGPSTGVVHRPWALTLGFMVMLVACGESTPGGTDVEDPTPADVDAVMEDLPAWSTVSPPLQESGNAEEGDPEGEPTLLSDADPRYSPEFFCQSTPYSLAKNPDKIVTFTSDAGLLVPGMLLQGKSHMVGTLRELSISQRAPVSLIINQTGVGNPSRQVEGPSLSTLQTAVNALIQDAETSQFAHSSSIDFQSVTSHSKEQAALGLGLSVRYLGSEASGALSASVSAEKSTVTASFTQNAFSIRVQRPDFASGWFSDGFTQGVLDSHIAAGSIGPDNLPLYVSEVTYGRIVTVNFTSTATASEIDAMFKASVNNGVGSVKGKLTAQQEEMVQNAEIRVVQLGGPPEAGFQFAKEIVNPDDPTTVGLDVFFAQDVPLTTFVPISYTLSDLRTGEVAKVGEAAEYEVLECAARAESDFEVDTEGWLAANAAAGYPKKLTSSTGAHSGSGYLRVHDGNSDFTYFLAPEKYLGDKSGYVGGQLTFWTKWWVEPGTSFGNPLSSLSHPDVRITSSSSTKILVFSAGFDDPPWNTWVKRTLMFEPSASLRVYDPTAGEAITDAVEAKREDIEEVLADIAKLEVKGELRAGRFDSVYLDDVRLIPPFVEPEEGN